MRTSSVFHVRLRDFELQAERILDASLRTRPVAIISSNQQDGTIISLSSEAKEDGLYRGMKVSMVRKISHGTLLLPYNKSLYSRLNNYLYTTITNFSPIVEPVYFGQFYLDMTGTQTIYPNFQQTGLSIIKKIDAKTNLSGIVGISSNKLVSGISTAVVPEKIYEVSAGQEAQFLSPLATSILPAFNIPKVNKIVKFLYLDKIKDVQKVVSQSNNDGKIFFGKYFKQIAHEAMGKDTSSVRPPNLKDHIVEQMVLPRDTNDEYILRSIVKTLAEQIGFKLRKRRQIAYRVKLEIHYTDGYKNARHGAFSTNDDSSVIKICQKLFSQANYRRNRIRAILIDASAFYLYSEQLSIFKDGTTKAIALSKALDQIRRRHGFRSIHSAVALGNIIRDNETVLKSFTL